MPISDYHKLEPPLDFPKDFLAYNINPEKCTLKILQISIKNARVAFTCDESVNRDSMAYDPFVQKFKACIRKIQSTRDKDAAKWFFYVLRRQFIALAELLYGNAQVNAENALFMCEQCNFIVPSPSTQEPPDDCTCCEATGDMLALPPTLYAATVSVSSSTSSSSPDHIEPHGEPFERKKKTTTRKTRAESRADNESDAAIMQSLPVRNMRAKAKKNVKVDDSKDEVEKDDVQEKADGKKKGKEGKKNEKTAEGKKREEAG